MMTNLQQARVKVLTGPYLKCPSTEVPTQVPILYVVPHGVHAAILPQAFKCSPMHFSATPFFFWAKLLILAAAAKKTAEDQSGDLQIILLENTLCALLQIRILQNLRRVYMSSGNVCFADTEIFAIMQCSM